MPGVHDGGLDSLVRGSRGIGFLGDWHNEVTVGANPANNTTNQYIFFILDLT